MIYFRYGGSLRSQSISVFGLPYHNTHCNFHTTSCHFSTLACRPNRILHYNSCMPYVYMHPDVRSLNCKWGKLWILESYISSTGCHHSYHKDWKLWSMEHWTRNLLGICILHSHSIFSCFLSMIWDIDSKSHQICMKDT